ncbi:hypothetical protein A176_007725 [Myxococcus hansupus]|uniref:Carboxypeptidase regulatory-like domain-containing protein n=1 Tax=Pseudomyxococcus hansupus TaxID=1297742 RepID=A0A0H4X9V4_9BACT|nr:hypothetical protein A176_007725 [Myxococcus hansupus]
MPAAAPVAQAVPAAPVDGSAFARVEPPPSAPMPPEGLRLRVVLEGGRPFEGEARVGAAFISEADRQLWEVSRREGSEGAGPERLEDLANVEEWLPAEVTPTTTGGMLGPVPVPVAPRYQVMAWAPDGTFWWGDVVPEKPLTTGVLDGGVLQARHPTGVRVRLSGARSEQGPFFVRVERAASLDPRDAERASAMLPVVRQAAPQVASALSEGAPLPLSMDSPLALLPLPADPQVRLWLRSASGQEGGPVEVPLREGRVESVVLDVERLFPEGVGGTVTLRGRLVLEGAATPPEGVTLLGPGGQALALASDGRFTSPGLPSWTASRFVAEVPSPESGRPVAAARQTFDFVPEPGVAEAHVTWRVAAYRWLVLRMDGFLRGQLDARARRPYPVFVLQRWSDGDVWRTHGADAFLHEEGGVAVSLLEPGRYRVLVALSAHEHHVSTVAEVGVDGAEHAVSVQVEAAGPTCEVLVTAAGVPVYGARVMAGSEVSSLPPVRGLTDAEGRWRLGRVRSEALHLEVEAAGHSPWAGEAAEACQRLGVVHVRL